MKCAHYINVNPQFFSRLGGQKKQNKKRKVTIKRKKMKENKKRYNIPLPVNFLFSRKTQKY
jgi:hypothetical protein